MECVCEEYGQKTKEVGRGGGRSQKKALQATLTLLGLSVGAIEDF